MKMMVVTMTMIVMVEVLEMIGFEKQGSASWNVLRRWISLTLALTLTLTLTLTSTLTLSASASVSLASYRLISDIVVGAS